MYSASEEASVPERLKDDKIEHLESTVATLNSRIQDLEARLQAAKNRPSSYESPTRQSADARSVPGSEVRPSFAANDPGAGYANDERFRAFQQGKLLFDQEKYPEAILAFSAFMERSANHPLASSAQYYIGESYFRQGDYPVADQEFQRVLLRYPNASRTSHALVRLAQSNEKLGKHEESRRYRAQVEGLFPKSPALTELGREAARPTVANPTEVPEISIPEVAMPNMDRPSIEAPKVEAPRIETQAPSSDLDGPPGGGG